MIPQDFVDTLLSRIDIVDVVDQYVPLKKNGQNYLACCPFHKEKSPSFTVSPVKQFYHCFGCGVHGSAIGFVMQYQGLSFVDAVQLLADGVGIPLPDSRATANPKFSSAELKRKTSLEQILQTASVYYKRQLKSVPGAIEYLKSRGVSGDVARRFGLGFSPPGRHSLETVFPGDQGQMLVEAGLLIFNQERNLCYERFRGRVMFPIRNQRGVIIGFGGRLMGKGEPKYLNSPETPLFEKSLELYGLYEARQAINNKNRVLVVEGYMDVLALAQFGVDYAVATMGTATTSDHVRKLLRHADEIYFCFDGDQPGQKAAWRALENSLAQLQDGKTLNFLFLPKEHDPDSYIREFGGEAFEKCLEQQSLPLSVYLTRELCRGVNLSTPEGRADLIHQSAPLLTKIRAPALRLIIKKRLAELAGVDVIEFDILTTGYPPSERKGKREHSLPEVSFRAKQTSMVTRLIKWLLLNPDWARDVCLPDSMALSDDLACFAMLAECIQGYEQLPNTAQLMEGMRDTPYEGLLGNVLQQALQNPDEFSDPSEEDRQQFQDGIFRLVKMQHQAQVERLKQKDRSEGLAPEEVRLLGELLREFRM